MRIAPQGQDIRFDEQQIVEGRNFCNKLWNACRFRLLQGSVDATADPSRHALSIFAKDLLAKLHSTISRVETGYADYRFSEIAQSLYDFVWAEFCDRFIEVAKADFGNPVPESRHAGDDGLLPEAYSPSAASLHSLRHRRALARSRIWALAAFNLQAGRRLKRPPPEPKAESVFRAVTLARTLRANYQPSLEQAPALACADAG